MGQHNVAGASKGGDYKKDQNLVSRFVTCHSPGKHKAGMTFKMVDKREYVVDPGGSFRRV